MRKHDLVIGVIGIVGGCLPSAEHDENPPRARHFSGAEWVLDESGNVLTTNAVLVERSADASRGIVIRLSSDDETGSVDLTGDLRRGVLRVVDAHRGGKRILELTPVSDDDYDRRLRENDSGRRPRERRRARWRTALVRRFVARG